MKRKISILLVITLLISSLTACASGDSAVRRFQKQIKLGGQYLSEMNYEKAIVAYREAIEIDPKNAEAYVGLAEVYKSMGNYQQEWEVLREGSERTQDSRIADMLAEVTASIETIEGTEESSSTGETKESTEASTDPTEESTDPKEESSVEPTTESTPEPTSTSEPTLEH